MMKKYILLLGALALLLAANLTVSYRVSVDGRELPGTFSRGQLRRCMEVSRAVAEEILPGDSYGLGKISVRRALSFSPAGGDSRWLCDAIISSYSGVSKGCQVFRGGEAMGLVDDPEALINACCDGILEAGQASPEILLRPVYCRSHF